MSLSFANFDATVTVAKRLRAACQQVGIPADKCDALAGEIAGICEAAGSASAKAPRGTKRPPTRWQQCIQEGMQGKKWDPSRIKELSKLYREGKCPRG